MLLCYAKYAVSFWQFNLHSAINPVHFDHKKNKQTENIPHGHGNANPAPCYSVSCSKTSQAAYALISRQ